YAGVRADIALMFYGDKLGMIRITFDPDDFYTVIDSLHKKFGEPATRKSKTVTNRMGAVFENQILEWMNGSATIRAKKYASRVDKSSVEVFIDSYVTEFNKRDNAKTDRGSMDM
ncbi:MAG: hypothetical protein VKL39_24980, partial [Leptolyngbyaceae bacterium]|nr:hypothetical protein [Leptolyngbyaceae bacterium]